MNINDFRDELVRQFNKYAIDRNLCYCSEILSLLATMCDDEEIFEDYMEDITNQKFLEVVMISSVLGGRR